MATIDSLGLYKVVIAVSNGAIVDPCLLYTSDAADE